MKADIDWKVKPSDEDEVFMHGLNAPNLSAEDAEAIGQAVGAAGPVIAPRRLPVASRFLPVGPDAAKVAEEMAALRRYVDDLRSALDGQREACDALSRMVQGMRMEVQQVRSVAGVIASGLQPSQASGSSEWFKAPRARKLSENDVWRDTGLPQWGEQGAYDYKLGHPEKRDIVLVRDFRVRVESIECACVVPDRGYDHATGRDIPGTRFDRVVLITRSGDFMVDWNESRQQLAAIPGLEIVGNGNNGAYS